MIRIALCDDNIQYLALLKTKVLEILHKHFPSEQIFVDTYPSSMELEIIAESHNVADIFILDVDMPGVDGFKLAKTIHDQNAGAVIFFVSSHMEHADQGYLVHALRYIDKARLHEKLEPALLAAIQAFQDEQDTYVVVSFDHNLYRVGHSQILFAEYAGRQLTIHTRGTGTLRDSRTLKALYEALQDPRFIWIDRSVFVNADYVRAVEEHEIVLTNGSRFTVSRRQLTSVKTQLLDWWGSRS